jgi:hypothetical protein
MKTLMTKQKIPTSEKEMDQPTRPRLGAVMKLKEIKRSSFE